jgi:hypothetical protein
MTEHRGGYISGNTRARDLRPPKSGLITTNTTTEARPTVEELIKATAAALAKPPQR